MVPESWPLVSRWPQCWWWHSKDLFSVQYITVDSCIGGIIAWGPGTLMVMLDVAGTDCNVAIHILWISCFWPLGMKWQDNKYYVDMVLLFGLRSAWNIFTCYCRHGTVDADLSPWCWLPLSLFRWFFHPGSPSLFGVSQQFSGEYLAVFQTRPPSSPGQAGGPVYLPVDPRYWAGTASYWQETVKYYSAGNMVWQAILQTAGVRVPYWPPPPWVQDCPQV